LEVVATGKSIQALKNLFCNFLSVVSIESRFSQAIEIQVNIPFAGIAFDYQAIFLTLRNADKSEINPRFIGTTFKLPVLKYLKDPQKKFNGMF